MKTPWEICDLIDLEYYFHLDEDMDGHILDQRDRNIFKHDILSPTGGVSKTSLADTPWLIRQWLEIRRSKENNENKNMLLPGQAYAEFYRTLKFVFIITGGIVGVALAAVFLRYSGSEPINVSYYLGALVFAQLVLAIGMISIMVLGSILPLKLSTSPLYLWLGCLLGKGIEKIIKPVEGDISTSRQQGLQAVLDLIRLKNRIYGKIFYWPIFLLAQMFGVALNLGVLSGTLIRVLGTDLAFGWQTTLRLAPAVVFKITQVLAMPWKWFVPDHLAHPGLDQIIGSRIILKDGIQTLATQDLASWWPFLCFAIVFYGLLPRVVFLFSGIIVRNQLLKKLTFSHGDCHKLTIRMKTPLVNSAANSAENDIGPLIDAHVNSPVSYGINKASANNTSGIVFVPEDIDSQHNKDGIMHHFGHTIASKDLVYQKISLDMEVDEETIDRVIQLSDPAGNGVILLLLEAWQPPIKETLGFIKQLRDRIDTQRMIVVGLIGKPKKDDIFTEVREEDFVVWKQKINSLKDPYLLLERPRSHD